MSDAFTRQVVTFGRVLREAGMPVGPGPRRRRAARPRPRRHRRAEDVYWTLRTTLASCHEDLAIFDRAFDAWFLRRYSRPPRRPRDRPAQGRARRAAHPPRGGRRADDGGGEPEEIGTSAHEVLRRKDFAAMTPTSSPRRGA